MRAPMFSAGLLCVSLLCACTDIPAQPHPGTQASLKRYIDSLYAGQPNYDEMTSRMADVVRRQLPGVVATLRPLGAPLTMTFEKRAFGSDYYLVTFQHGKAEWHIAPLTADGKVAARGFTILEPSRNDFVMIDVPEPPFVPESPILH